MVNGLRKCELWIKNEKKQGKRSRIYKIAKFNLRGALFSIDYDEAIQRLGKINFIYNDIEKQYATAYSYYLRCAEYTDNNIFAAESLIRCSLCINKQKNRDEKELYLIKHAITASPCSIEPYYIASLYFSWRSGNAPEKRLWLDSYMYACMGINLLENNLETVSFKNDIGYSKENIYYQKAYAGKNIGKIDEARDIYTRILTSFDISDSTRKFITLKKAFGRK